MEGELLVVLAWYCSAVVGIDATPAPKPGVCQVWLVSASWENSLEEVEENPQRKEGARGVKQSFLYFWVGKGEKYQRWEEKY